MSIDQFYNKTYDIIRSSEVSELGDEIYRKVGTLKGFFQQTTGGETFLRQQQFNNVTMTGFVSIYANVEVGDRLQNADTKEAYRVLNVIDAAGRKHHKEIYVEVATNYIDYPVPLE